MTDEPRVYGVMAEFEDPARLIEAARRTRDAGYKSIDAYSPYPIEGLHDALGAPRTILPLLVLLGGLVGGGAGYTLQYWVSVIAYPLNVGGRPLNSWPAFVPVTFELTILGAAFAGVFAFLVLNRLPQLYHPVFNVDRFERATQDRFFICAESADRRFDRVKTRQLLQETHAVSVEEVRW